MRDVISVPSAKRGRFDHHEEDLVASEEFISSGAVEFASKELRVHYMSRVTIFPAAKVTDGMHSRVGDVSLLENRAP